MKSLILNNGIAYIDGKLTKRTIFIKGKEIVNITESSWNFPAKKNEIILNCNNKWILPGLIDPHVHFRIPGGEKKENWDTGSKAALAGGVTTVLDMPNTNPPTTNQQRLQEKKALAEKISRVNFGFHIGASKNNLEEISAIQGAASIKIYFGSTTGNLLMNNPKYLKEIIKNTKIPLTFHAENEKLIQENIKKTSEFNNYQTHGFIRNEEVAHSAVKEILKLLKDNPVKIYFCHISTKKELVEIEKAKQNQHIFCEVTPHHLFFNENLYQEIGHFAKVNPPLRKEKDRLFLYQALVNNKIDIIATDHAPHLKQEKQNPYQEAPSGVPGLETMLPLLLNEVHKKNLRIQEIIKMTCENPALFFCIKNKAKIKPSYDADLIIVNPNKEQILGEKGFYTKCQWSPFQNKKTIGQVETSIVLGNIVYNKRIFFPFLGKAIHYQSKAS